MQTPPLPLNETARLAALRSLQILDTPREERYDRITRLAQQSFKVPIALVSLVDAERQWFKSCQGLDATQTSRDISFCGHAILGDDALLVPNALNDPRFADNPLVTGPPHIRFYAGQPLRTRDGNRIGTLCVIDTQPRELTSADLQALLDLAALVEQELSMAELWSATVDLNSSEARLHAIVDNMLDGVITITVQGMVESMNPAAEKLFGYTAAEVLGCNVSMLMPEPDRSQHDGYLARYLDTGERHIIGIGRKVHGRRKDGSIFPMDLEVTEMWINGLRMFTGIVRDITKQVTVERRLREQEKLTSDMIDNLTVPTFIIDSAHHVLKWNKACEELTGVRANEVLGTDLQWKGFYDHARPCLADLVVGQSLGEGARYYGQYSASKFLPHGVHAESWFDSLGGKRRYVIFDAVPLYDNDGHMIAAIESLQDITEQKLAEQALAQTTALQRAILDSANYSIISTDPQGMITTFSAASEQMLGYRAEEMVGKQTPAIIHELDEVVQRAAILSQELGRPIEPGFDVFVAKSRLGKPDENEWTYIRKDGSRLPVLLSVTTLHSQAGEITGYLGVAADITERKRMQQALQESEARYRLIAEYASDMITRLSADGMFEYVSPASAMLLGYPPEDLLGHSLFELIHPNDQESVRRAFDKVAQSYLLDVMTYRVRGRDGDYIWLESSLRGLRNEQSHGVQQIVAVSRDVTERVRTTQSLNRFKSTLDNTLDMIFMFEPDTLRFVYLNRGAVESMGYTREELLGMTPCQIKPLLPEPMFRSMIAPLLSGERASLSFETVHRRKDGSDFPVEVLLQLVREGHEQGLFVATVRDITERKKVDRLKNEFVSTVSHELRTPLTSIRGSLGLLMGGVAGELAPQTKNLIDIAYKNSERLVRLINDILDIEKIESGKMSFQLEPQPLMPLLEQALEANRDYGAPYGVRFELIEALPGVMVNVDYDRLLQVMSNLLSNAAKYSPPNDRVEVTVTARQGMLRVSVSDHGTGIPEAFRDKIFEKFSQADSSDTRQKGGSGLGLSITKAIVERMGGSIGFVSSEGAGTSFFFELPQWHQNGVASSQQPTPILLGRPRVLVCEDDADVAHLIAIMLNQGGFDADIAHSMAEARQCMQAQQYAAMTLDLGLPDGDGVAFIRELRGSEATRTLPIVVVSGRTGEMRAEIDGGFAVVDWLGKPIDSQALLVALQQAVHSIGGFKPRILHVEDDADIRSIVASLTGGMADYDYAASLQEAGAKLSLERYNLVILDISLPDGNGWELLPRLKSLSPVPPVLVFSAHDTAQRQARQVTAALIKSQTTNQELLETISNLVRQGIASANG